MRGDSVRLSVVATGPPPAKVLLPGNLIPDTTSLAVGLGYSVVFGIIPISDMYRVGRSIRGGLRWTIEPVPTEEGPGR